MSVKTASVNGLQIRIQEGSSFLPTLPYKLLRLETYLTHNPNPVRLLFKSPYKLSFHKYYHPSTLDNKNCINANTKAIISHSPLHRVIPNVIATNPNTNNNTFITPLSIS